MSNDWVFLNDRFVPESEAKISVFDYGFLYGDGLFETMRSYSGKIFALHQHLERLALSAKALQLNIPDKNTLKVRLNETLARNQLSDALLRLTVTRGTGGRGFHPGRCSKSTLVIAARPLIKRSGELEQHVADAVIVSTPRVSATGSESCLKSLNFLNNIVGKLEADRAGVFEGIFLNKEGFLAEGTISNLFWIKNDVLLSPSPEALILKGITREIIIELAKKTGMKFEEGLYRSMALLGADEAFLTNSAIELLPLTVVNGKKISSGHIGPITRRLQALFKKNHERYQ